MLLTPHWVFDDYTAVTPDFLRAHGVTLLLTDLDYTLAPKSVREPDDAVRAWLAALAAAGVTVAVLSNNRSRGACSASVRAGHRLRGPRAKALTKGLPPRAGEVQNAAGAYGDARRQAAHGYPRCKAQRCAGADGGAEGGARGPWQKVLHALQEPFKRASAHDERMVRQ